MIIEKMKNNKLLKPKPLQPGLKIQITEQADIGADDAFLMFENQEDHPCVITQKYKVDGWRLVGPSDEA